MALAMFPLGSALVPGMPLVLRVFEPRYLAMMRDIAESQEFGVVLIERGQEVGGGDTRFRVGTVARIGSAERSGPVLEVVARGTRRVEVVDWLPDDPYPRADVRAVPDLVWDEADRPALHATEKVVRQALARAVEFGGDVWPATVGLADDPVLAAWQLAGVAPVPELDRMALLGARSVADLLERTAELTRAAW